ncbi:Predicted dehydrogenase [Geodermatophilus dictyosporus]|uniref:Predicted dehydrogenase n=1 Tax=Geodermatophilus dictyosporus TaxID=1523247 RepID=A0A1I5JJA4_9ACTN|nr:Gfo/Idh/MocA family oxidoreductase [Geodermatophilus dictyosporus]SFO72613.1 Predicted dehydrogenase [Geodermatophilus dictyosporus]
MVAPSPHRASPVPAVLVGAHGHGRWHLENVARATRAGVPVRLAGICDTRPLTAEQRVLAGDVPVGPRLAELLEVTGPGIAIVSTPIHTHAGLALTAARAGSDVLLEKPPTPTLAGFEQLAADLAGTGRLCQVGFQSLGSRALPQVRALVADGAIGEVLGIGAAGAWQRDAAYYGRAPWAGRRSLDGVPVVDGALTNPFAHATATALAIDGAAAVADVQVELYRANPIEADDTSCLRVVTDRGTEVTVAVTLCADRDVEPYLVVHGTRGRITLHYRPGLVRLERGGEVSTTEHPATDLLEDLVASVREPGRPVLVPLAATRAFMQVVEAVRLATEPLEVPSAHRRVGTAGVHPHVVVPGVADAVERAAADRALFSELGLPWARAGAGAARG